MRQYKEVGEELESQINNLQLDQMEGMEYETSTIHELLEVVSQLIENYNHNDENIRDNKNN